jgi:hypothetical protein
MQALGQHQTNRADSLLLIPDTLIPDSGNLKDDSLNEESKHTARSAPVRVSYSFDFEQFWKEYPAGHGAKKAAYVAWKKLAPSEQTEVLAMLPAWHASERWQKGMVKDAAAFLKNDFWRNPPPATSSNGKSDSALAYFQSQSRKGLPT